MLLFSRKNRVQPDLIKHTSGTETLVPGKWWESSAGNYKPVYRKVISIGALPSSGSKSVAHGLTGIHYESVRFTGNMVIGGNTAFPIPYAFTGNNVTLEFNSTNIVVYVGANYSSYNGWVTVEYSKTTDSEIANP